MKILNVSSFEKLKINSMSLNDFNKIIIMHQNKYGITQKDMIDLIKEFPVGVVVKMMEEQEKQGNEPDVKIFQKTIYAGVDTNGFDWEDSADGWSFWNDVMCNKNFDAFFEKYPEYEKYN